MISRRYARLAIGGLLGVGIVIGAAWSLLRPAAIDPDNPTQVALGRQIYAERCAMCHGANLEGQPNWMARNANGRLPAPPHDVSGHTWHHADQQLMVIIKKGMSGVVPGYQSDMPAFEGVLTDAEIASVLAFIESNWPSDIRSRQRALTRATS